MGINFVPPLAEQIDIIFIAPSTDQVGIIFILQMDQTEHQRDVTLDPTFIKTDQIDPWIKDQLGKAQGPVSI